MPPVDPETFEVDLDSPTLVGDPVGDSEVFLFQGEAGTCAPTTVAMMLADVLNVPLESNADVVQRAVDEGLITYDPTQPTDLEWSGMTPDQIVELCELYGLDVESRSGTTGDLADSLASGESVMVGVDASEIAYNSDEVGDLGLGVDHVAMVTGIDETRGVVFLNNPNDDRGTIAIPIDQFRDAWADAGNLMITTLPEDQAAETLDPAALGDLTPLDPQAGPGDPLLVPATGTAGSAANDPALAAPAAGERNVLLPFTFVAQSVARLS